MTPEESLVRQIHAAPQRAVLAITGGGSEAISRLLVVPGASRTVLEALVPYSEPALIEFLRAKPEHFCAARTARAMAMAAYQRALQWRAGTHDPTGPVLGIACTASLASEPPKKGPHRLHVAWQSQAATMCYSLTLHKGRRTRHEEEQIAATIVLNALAEACELAERLPTALVDDEPIVTQRAVVDRAWQALLAGETQRLATRGGVSLSTESPSGIIFPGAFNPWHQGHRRMAEFAEKRLGKPVQLEISLENVDKPPLDFIELQQRTAAIAERTVWLTRAPTFVRKAHLFRGATFVVGADTIERIAEPRYYGDSADTCRAAIAELVSLGTRFLVFGRLAHGKFETLSDLPLPHELRVICDGVSEQEFRDDVSSTALRSISGSNNSEI